MVSDIYKYPLDASKKQIRIALLGPGIDNDPIRVVLLATSIDNLPPYEALSYVWGDPLVTRTIYICNEAFQVTENLCAALYYLRHPHDFRFIWIDAICINQQDLAERSSQVFLMRQVYECCSRVVVWLGEENTHLSEARELLRWLDRDVHIAEMSYFSTPTGSEIFRAQARSLQRLMDADWWSRAWTLQEVILAPEGIVMCGSMTESWSTLVRASFSFNKHTTKCCKVNYFTVLGKQQLFQFDPFEAKLQDIGLIALARRDGMQVNLLFLLRKFRMHLATDPRDKVYGFLGLISDERAGEIAPDYFLPVESVYAHTAYNDILETKSLQILGYTFGKKNFRLIPSWVPDWTASVPEYNFQSLRLECYDLYDACKGYEASTVLMESLATAAPQLVTQMVIDIDEQFQRPVLLTQGLGIDSVACVGETLSDTGQMGSFYVFQQWRKLIAPDENPHNPYFDLCSQNEAFWRTVFCDAIWDGKSAKGILQTGYRRAGPTEHTAYYAWWDWYQTFPQETDDYPPDPAPGISINDVRVALYCAIMQRFFVSEKGYFGLGPAAMEIGDALYVLPGGKRPFILRPAGNQVVFRTHESGKCSLLIGESYVHGIMDGEAMRNFEQDKQSVYIC